MVRALTTITFLGGVQEIGGNKFLLKDRDTKILLDFGMSYAERRRFYHEPWLSPRDEKSLIEFGVLPRIRGVYRFDDSSPSIDAILLTHAHADHSRYVSLIKREIPVYCGEATATILTALSKTMTHDFESDIEGIQFRTFRTGAKIQIGSISVHPCHVDHSVPAAYGFVLQCSEGAIAYTGDFRMHGGKPEMTDDFVELASEWRPGLLLAEGTNIAEAHISSEQEVRLKIQLLVEKTRGIVLANFAYSDIDRLKTFYEVCRSTGRTLAISLRQAYLLESLSADASLELPDLNHDESIVAYRREKKRYADWEQVTIERCRTIDAADVKKDQRRYVMVCSLPDLTELLAIKPSPGSNFILSMSEPVNEEQEIEFEKMMNWLDHFGLPMYHAHSSGHIMPNDLRISIERIKPAGVAAIHTEHGGLFSKYLGGSAKILVPSKGEKLKVF